MKITVNNFQSVGRAVIEADGLTVITGRSNVGKTAFIRACAAALFGLPGDHYIRDGEHSCTVSLKSADLEVIWQKTKSPTPTRQTVLKINGHINAKLGKDHSQLTEPLGFKELSTTYSRIRPQFAMQHDAIFLLGENEATVAEVFKLLGRTDVVTKAQQAAKKDLKQTLATTEIRQKDAGKLKTDFTQYDHVPGLRKRFTELSKQVKIAVVYNERRNEHLAKLARLKELRANRVPDPVEIPSQERITQLGALIKLRALAPQRLPGIPTLELSVQPTILERLRSYRALGHDSTVDRASLKVTDRDLADLVTQRVRLEKELGICPTCERAFA